MSQLLTLIAGLVSLEIIAVLVWAVLSWFRVGPSPATRVLDVVVLPLIRPVRRVVPIIGGLDLSPLVLILGLQIAAQFLRGLASAA